MNLCWALKYSMLREVNAIKVDTSQELWIRLTINQMIHEIIITNIVKITLTMKDL